MPHERVVLVYLLTARPCASASRTDLDEQGSLQTIGNGTHLTRAIQGGVLANCFSGMQWSALLRWYVEAQAFLLCSPNGQTKRGQPVPMVHVDYTTKSGAERLDALVPQEEAQRLKQTPFAAIQVRLRQAISHAAAVAQFINVCGIQQSLDPHKPFFDT